MKLLALVLAIFIGSMIGGMSTVGAREAWYQAHKTKPTVSPTPTPAPEPKDDDDDDDNDEDGGNSHPGWHYTELARR